MLQAASGHYDEIGWIAIEGFHIRDALYDAIKGYLVHDTLIQHCELSGSASNNILMSGATRLTIDGNILSNTIEVVQDP